MARCRHYSLCICFILCSAFFVSQAIADPGRDSITGVSKAQGALVKELKKTVKEFDDAAELVAKYTKKLNNCSEDECKQLTALVKESKEKAQGLLGKINTMAEAIESEMSADLKDASDWLKARLGPTLKRIVKMRQNANSEFAKLQS